MTTQNIFDLVDTWNNGATTFTAVKMNVTDTASAAASLLMDLQVGSTSKFKVSKGGFVTADRFLGTASSGVAEVSISNSSGARQAGMFIGFGGVLPGFTLNNTGAISWDSSTAPTTGTPDTIITRRGIANLRLGAADTTGTTAPTEQFLSAQSWLSSTTFNQLGANFTIDGSQGTGQGAGGSIIFRVAPAGGTSNGVQNGLAAALTIDSTRLATFAGNVTVSGGTAIILPSAMRLTGYSGSAYLDSGDSLFHFRNYTTFTEAVLAVDSANTLALRNSTAAQAFRIYNTWTSFGSGTEIWERGNIFWDSNVLKIGTEKGANGGTARELEFQTNGTTKLTITTTAGSAKFGQGPNGQFGWYNTYGNLVFEAYESSSVRKFVLNGLLLFDGVSSSFPAIKRSTTFLQVRLADDTAFAGFASANMQAATAYTVATLPGTPGTGMIARVTDALAPTIGMTVAAGGAAYALVNYNGANWTVIGV